MSRETVERAAEAVECIGEYLKSVLDKKQMWENTYIKKQIDKREQEGKVDIDIEEHILGMVYAMLSSGISWKRMEKYIDENTGRISCIDEIFHNYDVDFLLSCSIEILKEGIHRKKLEGRSTEVQLKGLIQDNVIKLKQWKDTFGSIDKYYRSLIDKDSSYRKLIERLSQSDSKDKMKQMGIALTAEYLRNVGYDLAKPDRHLCRVLGSSVLACYEKEIVPEFEVMEIIKEIADILNRHVAEVDYILWSYCANGYGEICTSKRPLCCDCVVLKYCRRWQEKICRKFYYGYNFSHLIK